jgi:hypothetical protein
MDSTRFFQYCSFPLAEIRLRIARVVNVYKYFTNIFELHLRERDDWKILRALRALRGENLVGCDHAVLRRVLGGL